MGVLGWCLQLLGISCHGNGRDPFGRLFFSQQRLPCKRHCDSDSLPVVSHSPPSSFALRGATNAHEYEALEFWGSEIEYYLTCQPVHMRWTPHWWTNPYAISFHNYKNVSLLLDAYRVIYGKSRMDDCSPIVSGFDIRVIGNAAPR